MLTQYINHIWLTITAHPLFFTELALAIIVLASILFLKKPQPTQVAPVIAQSNTDKPKKSPIIITSQDIKAIAGDDIITTQLDLARAYIEIGKKKLAKKILEHVTQHGNASQQQAAQHLMVNL